MLTRSQILTALRSAARKLKRAPTRAEFMRLTGIHHCKLLPHFPGYRDAVRAAGLSPDPGGLRIGTAAMLLDWARLARRKGRVPTRAEYERLGRYAAASLETRFHRWSQVPAAFINFAESAGLSAQWSDVLQSIQHGPMPTRGGGRRWLRGYQREASSQKQRSKTRRKSNAMVPVQAHIAPPAAGISVLPPPLQRKRCVTLTMLAVLFSARSAAGSLRALVPRRVYPDRPLLGAPLGLPGFLFAPTNEMGVVLLFGMLAYRLGFLIESAQGRYPDCHAKIEVEPDRYQDVNIEFELHSRHFRAHRHDPRRADIIVCWIHNWNGCPPNLHVIELREVVRHLKQLPGSPCQSF